MASQKEEPNPSYLFGDAAGDDPFSQIQQQQQAPSVASGKRNSTTTAETPKNVVGDASSLFGSSNSGGADLFFSSAPATSQQQQQPIAQHQPPPLTANASAASFFEQPNPSDSFFDGLGQNAQAQPNAAASLTQAYDPNTYGSYDYSQQQQQQPAEQYTQQEVAQDQQQYDPNQQWIQFDPNQHYYYDEQGQVHYYDPNTNQEYDMSQYGYDQQGQAYDYQYDPQQYAEYYAQQGYDPNAYATSEATNTDQQQQAYTQDNYDPNIYAPVTSQQQQQNMTAPPIVSSTIAAAATTPTATVSSIVDNQQGYYQQQEDYQQQQSDDYYQQQQQAYTPQDSDAVAEVPALIQSEQTIDTQHYQQDQYQAYNEQQQDYNYRNYEGAEDLQQQQQYNQDYSQSDFFAEDLQQQQPQQDALLPSTNNTAPPPPTTVSAPPRAKSVVSPPPPPQQQTQAIAPPPTQPQEHSNVVEDLFGKESSAFQNEWLNPEQPEEAASAPPLSQQPEALVPTSSTSQRGSYDANVPVVQQESQQSAPPTAEDNAELDDLDDLVLGGSGSVKGSQQELAAKKDEFDLLMSTADYDAHNQDESVATATEKEHVYNNVNQYEEKPTAEEEASVPLIAAERQALAPVFEGSKHIEPKEDNIQPTKNFNSYEPEVPVVIADTFDSYEPQQPAALASFNSYEPQQQGQEQQYGAYDPQQYEQQQSNESFEPYQSEQAVDYSSYEPQQGEQAVDYSSYQPQEQAATTYEPHQTEQQHVNFSSYEPTSYEPQQQQSYEPEQVTTSYEPQVQQNGQAYESQQPAAATSFAPPPPPQKKQSESYFNNDTHPQQQQQPAAAAAATSNYAPPPPAATTAITSEPPRQFVTSPPPPPSRRNMISPPPAGGMQSFSQRSNSITEPDRQQSMSPFANYYTQQNMERSATVPPPMTERIASPRPALIACPNPQCEGENKAKAKFCCECGRPLAGISRSTTPSASLSPNGGGFYDGFSSMSSAASSAPPVPVRTALDERKDVMIEGLKKFNGVSVLMHADHQEKQKFALDYIDARVGEFEASKALLWHVVKLMIQYQDSNVLGDGGELDKSIVTLLSSQTHSEEPRSSLDKLENYLVQGDRDGACQFAMENDMWAHALIISQSHNPDHFKRVISQFIHRELFSESVQLIPQVPGDKKSLRMLYAVFSGAGEDAVSELAKNSEDQHITYTKESLEGWQRSLSFILANRSSKDTATIAALGDQLKQAGSIYDASICFALSPDRSLESSFVQILGSEGSDIYTDLDALYLTEFYEFALSSPSATKPKYLQNYKLIHAWWLSELGFTKESQIYCDSIVSSLLSLEDRSVILQELKQLGEDWNHTQASSDHVSSLLNKATFNTLIGTIEEKVNSSQNNYGGYGAAGYQSYAYDSTAAAGYVPTYDYSGQEVSSAVGAAADTNQQPGDTYNYGYGYGGSYTDQTADNGTAQAPAAAKIQSPFQQKIQSPFGAGSAAAAAPAAVRSPFQHSGGYAQPSNAESGGGWWGGSAATEEQTNADATNDEQQTYQPYQPASTNEMNNSYQPDAYAAPAAATANSGSGAAAWNDDEDDLGFGNTKKKSAKEESKADEKPAVEATIKEEKPNEKEEKKEEKPASGWGLFSLFGGRNKDKDPNSDEKKAVKANLGESSSFYYDEVEKRWKNKGADLAPPVAATPPPPKTMTSKPPIGSSAPPPPTGSLLTGPPPPPSGKPASMPPTRIHSTANVLSTTANRGPPNAATPSFNTPPPSGRKGGAKKPMRSRYVDVLNTNQ